MKLRLTIASTLFALACLSAAAAHSQPSPLDDTFRQAGPIPTCDPSVPTCSPDDPHVRHIVLPLPVPAPPKH